MIPRRTNPSLAALAALAALGLAPGCAGLLGISEPIEQEVVDSKEVGAGGGQVRHRDGVVLDIPPGAIPEASGMVPIRIVAEAASPPGAGPDRKRYRFEPANFRFDRPVKITMPIPAEIGNAGIYWSKLPEGDPDAEDGYDHIGGSVGDDTGTIAAHVVHLDHGFVGDEQSTRTIVGVAVTVYRSPSGQSGRTEWSLNPDEGPFEAIPLARGDDNVPVQEIKPGIYAIRNAGAGAYWLHFGTLYQYLAFDTAFDAGDARLGQPGDTQDATTKTRLVFDVDGLTPWTATDRLQVFSTDADVWWFAAQNKADPPETAPGVDADALRGFGIDNLRGDARGKKTLIHGDLTLTQLSAQRDAATPYLAATGSLAEDVDQADGSTTHLQGTLTPLARSSTLSARVDPAPFSEGLPPAVRNQSKASFAVRLQAGGLGVARDGKPDERSLGAFSGGPDLLVLGTATVPVTASDMKYAGKPFDGTWGTYWVTRWEAPVAFSLPDTQKPFVLPAVNERQEAAPKDAPASIVTPQPLVAHVANATIGGKAMAFADVSGVGVRPTLEWTAAVPALRPTFYRIEIRRLGVGQDAAGNAITTAAVVGSFQSRETRFEPPVDLFEAGKAYVVSITAVLNEDPVGATSLRRVVLPHGEATVVSGIVRP